MAEPALLQRWPDAPSATGEVVPFRKAAPHAARIDALVSRAGGKLTAQRLADLALEEDQAARSARARGDLDEARACEIVRDTLCDWFNAANPPVRCWSAEPTGERALQRG